MGGVRILTDPVLGRRAGPLRRLGPPPPSGVAAGIHGVLLSHLHSDHADLPSLRRVGAGIPVVAPPAAAAWLRSRGFSRVRELRPGNSVQIESLTIEATPADHDGRRWPFGPAAEAIGFLVEGSQSAYFAGDTDLFPEMANLAGRVDVALLPVWGWGPTLGPGHLDPQRAAEAAATIRPKVAIPIHWGTLATPWARPDRDAIVRPARTFADTAARVAPSVETWLLEPGECVRVPRGEVVRAPGRW